MAINSKVSTLSTQASGGEEIVRITVRKGNEADFLPSEMLPGELAISTDKGIARYCYSAGKIKVFATREDIYEILGASAEEFEKFQELIEYLKQNQNVYDEIIANLNSLEENKQDNLIESLSGASEYISEAHDGAGIIRKFPGKTYQVKTNGYQLFDESKLPTKTQGGATVTNNGDGSFTVSGSGTLTQSFSSFYTDFDFKKWLKVGNITAKINEFKRPYFLLTAYAGVKAVFTLTPSSTNGYTSSHYITEDEFASITNITYGFTGNSGDEILTGTVKPMVYQDGDGTWEPYTGGKPGPNPEYPLKVQGVGNSDDGEYAAVVKSHTLQLFDASKFQTASAGGATVTNNGDGSLTVSGSGKLSSNYENFVYYGNPVPLKPGKLKLYIGETSTYPLIQVFGLSKIGNSDTNNRVFTLTNNASINITEDMISKTKDIAYVIFGLRGSSIVSGTIKPILFQDGDDTWQRFASSEARIPLSQPMYDGDYVYIKDGELWVHRENGVAVFDGSEDEKWDIDNVISITRFYIEKNDMKRYMDYTGKITCDKFLSNPNYSTEKEGISAYTSYSLYPGENWIYIAKNGFSSVSELKTWLQSNPITVVYKLATPVEEKITSAEPYTLRTYTPQTRIWTPDELEPEIEVDIPKNLAGGYATDGYAQATKNQAVTAEQEAIKARLLSLEQLAIKEV